MQVAAEQDAARKAEEEDEGPLEVEGFLFKRLLLMNAGCSRGAVVREAGEEDGGPLGAERVMVKYLLLMHAGRSRTGGCAVSWGGGRGPP